LKRLGGRPTMEQSNRHRREKGQGRDRRLSANRRSFGGLGQRGPIEKPGPGGGVFMRRYRRNTCLRFSDNKFRKDKADRLMGAKNRPGR